MKIKTILFSIFNTYKTTSYNNNDNLMTVLRGKWKMSQSEPYNLTAPALK